MDTTRDSIKATTDAQSNPSLNEVNSVDASFRQTFASIQALLSAEKTKAVAVKDLVVAETKLSFSAILVCVGMALAVVAVSTVLWATVNVAIAFLVYALLPNYFIAISIPLVINVFVTWALINYIKRTWCKVGLKNTIDAIQQGH